MLIDAVFPAASEVVMVYAGRVASGAFAGQDVVLFGTDDRRGAPGVRRDRARRHDRLHDRRDHRLGDRSLRRASVPRASRPLAPPRQGEARSRGALVRALGELGRVPRAAHAGRALVRLDSGGRDGGAARALHAAHARRLRDLVLRLRGRRATLAGANWEDFHHAFRYVDYVVAAAIVGGVAWLAWRYVKKRRRRVAEESSAG